MMHLNQTAVIVGLGQIGGSLGLALKKAGYFNQLGGYDIDPYRLKQAKKFLDFTCSDLDNALNRGNVVILAVPIMKIIEILEHGFKRYPQKLFIDVGSTKLPMFLKSKQFDSVRYIGGHPMAGNEREGASGWSESLFQKRNYFWIPDARQSAEDVEIILNMIHAIGAIPISVSAKEHDCAVTVTSHLPLLLSLGMMASMSDRADKIKDFVSGGIRSMTRLTGGSAAMGKDLLTSNKNNILVELDRFIDEIQKLAQLIQKNDDQSLLQLMKEYQQLYWRFIADKTKHSS